MDQIEPLFPIPLLRSPGLLPPSLNGSRRGRDPEHPRRRQSALGPAVPHRSCRSPRQRSCSAQIAELARPEAGRFRRPSVRRRAALDRQGDVDQHARDRRQPDAAFHAQQFHLGHHLSDALACGLQDGLRAAARRLGLLLPASHAKRRHRSPSMRASTSCQRPSPAISCCFQATFITRCREIRAGSALSSPSTPFPIISTAGAIASTSRPEWDGAIAPSSLANSAQQKLPRLAARWCCLVYLMQQARGRCAV